MLTFKAAPAVPTFYSRLSALSQKEIEMAISAAYVADDASPEGDVTRSGADHSFVHAEYDDMSDWLTRMYVVWFCYIYENFDRIHRPYGAIEELVLEFKGPCVLDPPGAFLGMAQLYVGATSWEPPADKSEMRFGPLRSGYAAAIALLEAYKSDRIIFAAEPKLEP